jgi:hypothetical protein
MILMNTNGCVKQRRQSATMTSGSILFFSQRAS